MKALILSAGFGTRMAPLTDTIPKPLLPVLNVPVIIYNIMLLKSVGITEIYINVHHGADKIMHTLKDGTQLGISITWLKEKEILGTGGAIGSLKGIVDETVLVLNADTVMDVDLENLIDYHHTSGRMVTLGLIHPSGNDPRAVVTLDDAGRIIRMIGSATVETLPEGNAVFSGVHVLEPALLEYIPPDIFISITSHIYTHIIDEGIEIGGYFFHGDWWDMGTPDSYLTCHYDLINRGFLSFFNPLTHSETAQSGLREQIVALSSKIHMPVVPVHPPVIIEDGVKIKGAMALGPYLVAGRGATIQEQNKTERAVFLEKADGKKVLEASNGTIYY